MKILCALFAVFITVPAEAQAREWLTPDFFVEYISGHVSGNTPELIDERSLNCRENIAKVMCLVDPVPGSERDTDDGQAHERPCLPGGQAYAHFFEELYDNYPPALQKMFCSLRVINIEKKFYGTAYAGLLEDKDKKVLGALMGIRKSVLDEGLSLATWASWKEQLSFGGVSDSYQMTPGLPVIQTASKPGVSDFLYFVVAHEFGHIFDFANGLNKVVDQGEMAPGSWGALTWRTEKQPLPENEFPNRTGLCFYWCKGSPLAQAAIAPLYAALYQSTSFISIYATTQPWDDFADSLAYFLVTRHLDTSYAIEAVPGKVAYDISAKLFSERFASKYQYLEAFLKRDDILYP